MAYVNIPRYRDDPNYRYKMPRIQSRIEGRGNGTKTNISNMGDIARALKRPPTYATKFFGCELGAMSKFEEAEEKALINGAHTDSSLAAVLDKFIELYVLCQNCQLPEIEVLVKRGELHSSCNACGHKGVLDMTHKAASYMIKNPISSPSKMQKEGSSLNKDKMNGAAKSDKLNGTKAEKVKKRTEKGDKVDKTEKADRSSRSHHDSEAKEREDDLSVESPELFDIVNRLRCYLEKGERSCEDFSEELHMLQLSQGFDNVSRFFIALSAIFKQDEPLSVDLFKEKIELVKAATSYSMTPKEKICALEYFIFQANPSEINNFPYYSQALYSNDILEGSDFIRYYNKATRHTGNLNSIFLRAKETIAPFIEWLQEDD
ncbi:eukaryotic translation initiation factor 5 [Theileria orientalis strain Shintoku]|uniref:Eukaryotic translation initiation factor 5 n=1 Tax=Theileria orientalis strain Shintoku TaxID=869250 RepID=J4C3R3_THEOR|nr:eukaryotic translation initiation factor 5 [Theileria orientalis strain Shintoku]BAM40891.1 eukaryotic translation initiation factor 5 [Theileria orientalis strain Shintoku]|eukprot:XP_009691192.1 eukaryotic translation initiation factor 5 [Theileria orientalis strain Shintoku]